MMERIAEFHDEEISRWIDWFTRLFEPILMAVIGLGSGRSWCSCTCDFRARREPAMSAVDRHADQRAQITSPRGRRRGAAARRGAREAAGVDRTPSSRVWPDPEMQPMRMEDLRPTPSRVDVLPSARAASAACALLRARTRVAARNRHPFPPSSRPGRRSAIRKPFPRGCPPRRFW